MDVELHRRAIRPRKVVIRAGIFLLLGAIVNIAVAWGCELRQPPWQGLMFVNWSSDGFMWKPPDGPRMGVFERTGQLWIARWAGKEESGFDRVTSRRVYVFKLIDEQCFRAMVPPWSALSASPTKPAVQTALEKGGVDKTIIERSSGWPFLTLRYWFMRRDNGKSALGSALPVDCRNALAIPVAWRAHHHVALPLLPIWPGFAINTLFYAAILWLLLALPGALRRRLRLNRGLCPACAYPVGASPVCTECGRPIPLSLRERVRVRACTS